MNHFNFCKSFYFLIFTLFISTSSIAQKSSALEKLKDSHSETNQISSEKLQKLLTLPEQEEISIAIEGNTYTIHLEKKSYRGENFELIIQGEDGTYSKLNPGPVKTYSGYIKELPDHLVGGVIDSNNEIQLEILTPHNETIAISSNTKKSQSNKNAHFLKIEKNTFDDSEILKNCGTDEFESKEEHENHKKNHHAKVTAGETVKQAELAHDFSYRAYVNRYASSVAAIEENLDIFMTQINKIWIRDAMVEHVLGKVIIRTDINTCPYEQSGNTAASTTTLSYFKDIWNAGQHGTSGSKHNIAALTLGSGGGGGWAYVGKVSEPHRYALSDGGNKHTWRGFQQHEIGHVWGLVHGHGDAEWKPTGETFGIMRGGPHDRATSDEVRAMIAERNSSGLKDIGPYATNIPPYGLIDEVSVDLKDTVTVDVLANDHDANGDDLTLGSFTTTSVQGGTISRSTTDSNKLVYTPPSNFSGADRFYYYADDGTTTNWGSVHVDVTGGTFINPNLTKYDFDFGTDTSPLNDGYTRITPDAVGDVNWTGDVSALERTSTNANDINKDFVTSSTKATLNIKIRNGKWDVVINMGDPSKARDQMGVKIEGQVANLNINSNQNQFVYVTKNQVEVSDGELNIELSDQGGADDSWVINRLTLVSKDEVTNYKVNTILKKFAYDLGPADAPLEAGFSKLTPGIGGDISWSETVSAIDRGGANRINNINRDFIYSNQTSTLSHKIANGIWSVVINMGDSGKAHDMMNVKAEGILIGDNITSGQNKYPYITASAIVVRDGKMDLEFSDAGGSDPDWIINRLTLEWKGALADALEDEDNDGVKNEDDICPGTPANTTVDEQGCEISPDQDTDGDGVNDINDKCPNTASGATVDSEGCSNDQLDDDNDGVKNADDTCPNTPADTTVDSQGCEVLPDQDTDNDGVKDTDDKCPNTASGASVNSEGCSNGQLDDDNDGVKNEDDTCPNTPSGMTVDAKGCLLIAHNIFKIQTIGETCPNENNAQIIITTTSNLDYKVDMGTDSYDLKGELKIRNMKSGVHNACIYVDGQSNKQCYSLMLPTVDIISASTSIIANKVSVAVDKGTPPYKVSVNDIEILNTNDASFETTIKNGDVLKIESSKDCEGVFAKTMELSTNVMVYPNPTDGVLNLDLSNHLNSNIRIAIADITGRIIIEKYMDTVNETVVELNLSEMPKGFYLMTVESNGKIVSNKKVVLK